MKFIIQILLLSLILTSCSSTEKTQDIKHHEETSSIKLDLEALSNGEAITVHDKKTGAIHVLEIKRGKLHAETSYIKEEIKEKVTHKDQENIIIIIILTLALAYLLILRLNPKGLSIRP